MFCVGFGNRICHAYGSGVSKLPFVSLVSDRETHRVEGERVVMLPGFALEILATRKIELRRWELQNLNDPYWRLYIPTRGEAFAWTCDPKTGQQPEIHLVPGNAYIISPRTTFSSRNPVCFGKWYVHFTLGVEADRASPGIYEIRRTEAMDAVVEGLETDGLGAAYWTSASIVTDALSQLPKNAWNAQRIDPRVRRALGYMEANLNRKITADEIACFAGLSVRNLNHLFREETESTPMRALLEFRLDKACRLLRHNSDSIEQIASDAGFPNRYYFSRMLREHRGVSPAAYRRGQV